MINLGRSLCPFIKKYINDDDDVDKKDHLQFAHFANQKEKQKQMCLRKFCLIELRKGNLISKLFKQIFNFFCNHK